MDKLTSDSFKAQPVLKLFSIDLNEYLEDD